MGIAISIGVTIGRGGGVSVAAPANSVLPAISGTLAPGSTLTTTDGTWSGSPTYTYQWKRDAVAIGGATAATYVLTASDVGTTITATVTASNAGGSASATSAGVAVTEGFDYFRRGEPLVIALIGAPLGSFDYFRRTEPIQGMR